MNVFAVHDDPEIAAQMLCDQHVVKMPTETAQMLRAVAHWYEVPTRCEYKVTHPKHPCTVWAASSRENAEWLYRHGVALCAEYYRRYGYRVQHNHRALYDIELLWEELEGRMPSLCLSPHYQAMPEQYRKANAVAAYRAFYLYDKSTFARWGTDKRGPPEWYTQGVWNV